MDIFWKMKARAREKSLNQPTAKTVWVSIEFMADNLIDIVL